MGTCVSKQVTAAGDQISSVLFGKTRRGVLALLFTSPEDSFYLREIARRSGAGVGPVQRELAELVGAGIIERIARGRQVYFRANLNCPVFPEIRSLVIKTAGLGDILRLALAPLASQIRVAFVFGSFARGEQNSNSDVDVMVIGPATFASVVDSLYPAQAQMGRELNPTVYPIEEFVRKVVEGHHFVTSVLGSNKIWLIGDDHELERLAETRMAPSAQEQRTGNRRPVRRRQPRPARLRGKGSKR